MGSRNILQGRRIMVVEDDYFIVADMVEELQRLGAEIVGPYSNIGDASAVLNTGKRLDAAMLDVNVRGEMVFPLAQALREKGVPFVFATGYAEEIVPDGLADAPRLIKPIDVNELVDLFLHISPA